jgi:translation initiation factor 3 subunit L
MADFDFVMQLEDLPNKNKQILMDLVSGHSNKPKQPKEIVSEFLGQFDADYKSGTVDNLSFITDFVYHKLSEETFKEKHWPKLEEVKDIGKLHEHVKLLYLEMYYRHAFSKLHGSVDVGLRCDAWRNYLDLFNTLVREQATLHECELPPKWVWEIFDESIYQFQNFCLFASRLKKDDPANQELLTRDDIPNFKEFEESLKELIKRSGVQDKSTGELVLEEKPRSKHFFGYYAYLALIKLYVSHGFVTEAFDMVQKISKQVITRYFKRSWGALISFFYYSGLSYILNGEILKGTKLLEKCCSFFYRYKHFLSKSMQADKYARLVERATLLLTIFLSFNKIETEDSISKVIGEKYGEKYSKLLKYDQATFEETFTSGCCKITKPILTADSLSSYIGQESTDLVPGYIQKLLIQLNKYRILNGVESVLLIYNKLPITKLAKILVLEAKEVEQYLKEYETIRQAKPTGTIFEQTFLKSFLTHLKSYSFEVSGSDIEARKLDQSKTEADTNVPALISELDQAICTLRGS